MPDLLDDVLLPLMDLIKERLRVAYPATSTAFDRATRRVGLRERTGFIANVGERREEPALENIPSYTAAGDGYAVAFDIADDDPLWVVISDRPHSAFWDTANTVYPTISETHNRANSFAFPGGSFVEDGAINPEGAMLVGAKNGGATSVYTRPRSQAESGTVRTAASGPQGNVTLEATAINLGDNASKRIVLDGDNVVGAADLLSWFGSVATETGVPLPPTIATSIGSVVSSAVKASAE